MNQVREDMNTVAVRIMEDWALMMVEPADDWSEMFDPERDFYVGHLEFEGVVSGTYAVVCQDEFASVLANNLLGGDDEIDEGQKRDAVCEMINVLSGNLLTSSYGEDVVFDLSSPHVDVMKYSGVETFLKGMVLSYRADDQPVAVAFIPTRISE